MVGLNQFSWLKKEARKIKYKAVCYVIDNKAFRGRVLDSLRGHFALPRFKGRVLDSFRVASHFQVHRGRVLDPFGVASIARSSGIAIDPFGGPLV